MQTEDESLQYIDRTLDEIRRVLKDIAISLRVISKRQDFDEEPLGI